MTDLKTCPFCGGDATLVTPIFSRPYVACMKNYCTGPQEDEAMAIAVWNGRVNFDDAQDAAWAERVAALEAAVAAARSEGMRAAARIAESFDGFHVSAVHWPGNIAKRILKAAEAPP